MIAAGDEAGFAPLDRRSPLRDIARMLLLPALVYLACYVALTFPLILEFRTHFFGNDDDGLQNVWNLWWIDYAITHLHRSPWFTSWLHYPSGVTLLAHTLTPFNGLVAIPLSRVLSQVATYNAIVVSSFVASGVTAFWLAHHVTRAYW